MVTKVDNLFEQWFNYYEEISGKSNVNKHFQIGDAVNLMIEGINYLTDNKCVWLPEYDEVADWLSDNKSKGLLLMGSCGRGKSLLCTKVIPTIVSAHYGANIICIDAPDINRFDNKGNSCASYHALLCIDDLGTESIIANNFGEKRNVFPELVDEAEKKGRLLIVTTNLTTDELRQRYGERTLDRLKAITRPVLCIGDSMRGG